MKILQWNVWFKESPKNIVEEIKRLDVDVICAQELIQDSRKGIDTAKEIAEILGYKYFYMEGDTWDNKEVKENQGNAIFTRLPIVNKKYEYVQEPKHNPPDASHEGRVYVEVTVNDNNKLIDIGCVHLSYSDHFEVTNHRKREVDNLVSIVANKKKKYLLCGDFNSEPDSYTIKKLSKYLINAGPDYSENSWTTKPFEYHGFVENSLNWRLDYVFSTKDVNVISAKIIKTKYSDHLPLMVEI